MKLCVILVRSGSKGLPDKNAKPFLGKPLLSYSVAQASASRTFDAIAVSSDSRAYLDLAQAAGANCLIERPADLASDTASSLDALRHAVKVAEARLTTSFETVTLLQATSPIRQPGQISEALGLLDAVDEAQNLVSVTATKDGPWSTLVTSEQQWARRLSEAGAEITRRQDAPRLYRINGSIYAWRRDALDRTAVLIGSRTLIYPMPYLYSMDIDSIDDLKIAEFVAKELLRWSSA